MDKETAIALELAFQANKIFEDFNKKYCRLVDFCDKEGINKFKILKQAAAGEISLYVFCENSSTLNLYTLVDNLDIEPYVIPFKTGELINSEGEIQVRACGVTNGMLAPLEQLKISIRLINNAGCPGFYGLSQSPLDPYLLH